ncbi:hypothetical protein M378DRAFT_820709 [Amanita muscaria Koide BX008]|uniref:Uncharacterized protein n=1 Tax=Amanita muscaria (strain Koide BX008) TaxID=946122 RepID=A0A0C2WZA5_AMAMK|nr:hypothetical protein M378DRAFT_820709 [Amanita muscaria Koide BX008]
MKDMTSQLPNLSITLLSSSICLQVLHRFSFSLQPSSELPSNGRKGDMTIDIYAGIRKERWNHPQCSQW